MHGGTESRCNDLFGRHGADGSSSSDFMRCDEKSFWIFRGLLPLLLNCYRCLLHFVTMVTGNHARKAITDAYAK